MEKAWLNELLIVTAVDAYPMILHVDPLLQVAVGIVPATAEKLCSYTPVLEKVSVVAVTPVSVPLVVGPLRNVPLTVLTDPVSVIAELDKSNSAPASMVIPVVTVTAAFAVTFAAVFEMKR